LSQSTKYLIEKIITEKEKNEKEKKENVKKGTLNRRRYISIQNCYC